MSEPLEPTVTPVPKPAPTARRRFGRELGQALQDHVDTIGDEQPALLTRREARGEGWAFNGLEQAAEVQPSARTMINMKHQGRTIE